MEKQQEKQLLPTWCYCYGEWQCDNNLSSSAFRLLTIINSLSDNGKRACYLSNRGFRKITGMSIRQIQNILRELNDLKYIDIYYTTKFKSNGSIRNIMPKSPIDQKRTEKDSNRFDGEDLFDWNWLEECE